MKKTGAFLIIVVLAVLAVGAAGCGTTKEPYTLVLENYGLTWMPEDAQGALYMDVPLMQGDDFLGQAFEEGETDEDLEGLGIDISQMDQAVIPVGMDSGEAGIVLGRFDFDHVREQLREHDLTEGTYLDIEFWSGDVWPHGRTGVAFFANGLAWGDEELVKSLVRVITGVDPSICEVADVAELCDRLPSWPPFMAMISLDPAEDFDMPNARAAAFVFAKEEGEDSMRFACAVEFEESDEAGQWYDAIRGREGVRANVTVRFLSYEGTMSLKEFVSEFY